MSKSLKLLVGTGGIGGMCITIYSEIKKADDMKKQKAEEDYRQQFKIGKYIGMSELMNLNNKKPNVILFGETGSGKSKIFNMLAGSKVALSANSSIGVTFQSTIYEFENVNIIDTAGLNEGETGSTVSTSESIKNLLFLLKNIESGTSLLILTTPYPRSKQSTVQNYEVFAKYLCGGNVPLVLIVTKCEEVDDNTFSIDKWKSKNKNKFISNLNGKMVRILCISWQAKTADATRIDISKVIMDNKLPTPWRYENFNSLAISFIKKLANMFWKNFCVYNVNLYEVIKKSCAGMSDSDARQLANEMHEEVEKRN
jgi:GTP-binding protein EngB required for normal cell division